MRIRLDQRGNMDPLLIPLVIAIVMLIGVAGFGLWAYTSYVDASVVEQAEIDEAVQAANKQLTEDLEVAFAEREKAPNRVYTSPQSSGSVAITYPKTWSVYSEENEERGTVDSYMHPRYVKNKNSQDPFALKMTITRNSYSNEVRRYNDRAREGLVTVKATQVAGVDGIRVDGQVKRDFDGALVMFPLRDKTLTIWTENNAFLDDFNNIVVKNLTFVP